MRLVRIPALLAALAVAALGSGCATRLEMGPGYYHYDTRVATSVDIPPATSSVQEPVVVYQPAPAPSRY